MPLCLFDSACVHGLFQETLCAVCLQVQGMSFLAGVLLLNIDAADAFVCLANLINRPSYLAFFQVEHELVSGRVSAGMAVTECTLVYIANDAGLCCK